MINWSYILVIISYLVISSNEQNGRLKVTLYYETLCPHCVRFINTQLLPTHEILHTYLDLDFVPFGKAKYAVDKDGKINFECQHGPYECYGNAVQACVLHQNLGDYTNLKFINCFLLRRNVTQCATYAHVPEAPLNKCLKYNNESAVYLAAYGKRTYKELRGFPSLVPSVFLNGHRVAAARKNLFPVICVLLNFPKECEGLRDQITVINQPFRHT